MPTGPVSAASAPPNRPAAPPAPLKAAVMAGMTATRFPAIDSTGPIEASIPAMARTAIWPPSPMPANHSPNALTTPATFVAMLSSGSPRGSMAPCSSRMADCILPAKLSDAASAAAPAAPATSPYLFSTPARLVIMPMALSSPRLDHKVDARFALSYPSGIFASSPSTASKTCWPVAPPVFHASNNCCVDSEKRPMLSSMRPSTSDVWNSLRKSFTLSRLYAPFSVPALSMEK